MYTDELNCAEAVIPKTDADPTQVNLSTDRGLAGALEEMSEHGLEQAAIHFNDGSCATVGRLN